MAPPKQRFVRVTKVDALGVHVHSKYPEPHGSEHVYQVGSDETDPNNLTFTEVKAAYSFLWKGEPKTSLEAMRRRIRAHVNECRLKEGEPRFVDVDDDDDKARVVDAFDENENDDRYNVDNKADAPQGLAGAIEAAIAEAVGAMVSAEQVKVIAEGAAKVAVAEAIENDRVRVHSVRINQAPPIRLDALTHPCVPDVVTAVAAGVNVWLVGPAGGGKSTIGKQVADILGRPFYPFSVGPTDTSSKIHGYCNVTDGSYVPSVTRQAVDAAGVLLVDEADNGHPSCATAMNGILDGTDECWWPDGVRSKYVHPEGYRMVAIAAANTFGSGASAEYCGRSVQDEAFMDRFGAMIEVAYDPALEDALTQRYAGGDSALESAIARYVEVVRAVRKNVEAARLPVVVGQRRSIDGAKLLAAGMPHKRVVQVALLRKMKDDTLTVATEGVAL